METRSYNPLLLLIVVNLRHISLTTAELASLVELTVQHPRGLLHILLADTGPERETILVMLVVCKAGGSGVLLVPLRAVHVNNDNSPGRGQPQPSPVTV